MRPLLFLLVVACSGESIAPEPAFVPPEPALRRLTLLQYQNTVRDLFGEEIVPPVSLEPDATLEGIASLGAAISSTSPLGVERYEAGAQQVAEQVFGEGQDPLPCTPSGDTDAVCAEDFVEQFGRRLFRRALTEDERTQYVDLLVGIGGESDFRTGAKFTLSAMLQSPHFLYRTEHTSGSLDAFEVATRLSYFLWNGPPDDALLDAAAAGELVDPESREPHVDRMLADPRFRRGVRDFFGELYQLNELDHLNKDPFVFPHTSKELWESAKQQTLFTVEHLIVDEDGDYRDLFNTRDVWVDARLAALYEIPAPTLEGFGWAELPRESGRRGLLGHASILGMHAHAVSSSATRRGQFIRTTLLCQAVPPPPADVDTSIPEATNAPTLRDRLIVHQEDPVCASCHRLLDNVGLALENFDGVGRFRTRENDAPIDPSGMLDGTEFDDAVGLSKAITEHNNFGNCLSERVLSYGVGHLITEGEEPVLEWLAEDFVHHDYSVRRLLRNVAMSDALATGGDL